MALEGRRHRRSRAVRAYRQNRFKGIKIAVMVVLILALCAVVGLFLLPKWLPGFDPLGVNPTEPTVPTEPKPDQVIHITAGGDVNVTDKTVAAGLKEGGYDARLILQVHDELMIEAHKDCAEEVATLLKTEMENAAKLSVPLTVEIASGKSWYDAK